MKTLTAYEGSKLKWVIVKQFITIMHVLLIVIGMIMLTWNIDGLS